MGVVGIESSIQTTQYNVRTRRQPGTKAEKNFLAKFSKSCLIVRIEYACFFCEGKSLGKIYSDKHVSTIEWLDKARQSKCWQESSMLK